MNPIVHAELSWLGAHRLSAKRDRLLVTLAGVLPDLDGLTLAFGEEAYGRWHHVVTHGLFAALLVPAVLCVFATSRRAVFLMAVAMFHLHLLCDLAGSGPGWPISYLWPMSSHETAWSGQWDLASWQNTLVGLVATIAVLACALTSRRTIVELFSAKADLAVVKALRARFYSSSGT